MLGMGSCYCRCDVQPGTVLKFDIAGNVLWKRSRGQEPGLPTGSQVDYSLYVDHASGELFAGGTLVDGEDEGALYKYAIDTDDPTVEWISNRNGFVETASPGSVIAPYNRARLIRTTDDDIVRVGRSNRTNRYDSSTGQATAQANSSFIQIFPGPSGDIFAQTFKGSSGSVIRQDASFATVASLASSSMLNDTASLFDDLVRVDSSMLCLSCSISSPFAPPALQNKDLATLDNDLNVLNTYDEANFRVTRMVNSPDVGSGATGYGYGRDNTSARAVFGLDLSAPGRTWSNYTMQSTGSNYTHRGTDGLLALDESGRLFTLMEHITNGSAPSKLQRRSSADGSIIWETDVGISRNQDMHFMTAKAGIVVAMGYFNMDAETLRNIIAMDADTGEVLWTYLHGEFVNGLWEASIDASGNVYAVGFYG